MTIFSAYPGSSWRTNPNGWCKFRLSGINSHSLRIVGELANPNGDFLLEREIILGTSPKNRAFSHAQAWWNQAILNYAGSWNMAPQLNHWLTRTGLCLGFPLFFWASGCSNSGSYTRVPPPGTWGSASNSYYSLPGNAWTPAAPGAIGSGVPAAPPAAAAQPTASNPTTNKTTSNGFTSGSSPSSVVTASGGSASGTSESNPVRIAVFSDENADESQVVPASAPPSSGTTTVPSSQLPFRAP